MESFNITNQKVFMNKLLSTESFDNYLLKEAQIVTSNTFHIDGMENRDFYGNDEDIIKLEAPYDYAPWSRMRGIVLSLIKGKHTPVSMKITMYLKPDLMKDVIGDESSVIDYLIINLHFGSAGMNITTGVAYREFTLDKDQEKIWDIHVGKMLETLGVGN